MKSSYKSRILVAVAVVFVIFVVRWMGIGKWFNLDYIASHRDFIQQTINNCYLCAVAGFIGIYAGIIMLLLPLTIPLNIIGGYFFGVIQATVYIMCGVLSGSSIVFFVARYLVGEYLKGRHGSALEKFNAKFRKQGIYYLLALQFFPFTPFPVINILAALSGISYRTFIISIFIGILPGSAIYAFAGNQLTHIQTFQDVFSMPVIIALLLLTALSLLPVVARYFKIIT